MSQTVMSQAAIGQAAMSQKAMSQKAMSQQEVMGHLRMSEVAQRSDGTSRNHTAYSVLHLRVRTQFSFFPTSDDLTLCLAAMRRLVLKT